MEESNVKYENQNLQKLRENVLQGDWDNVKHILIKS